MGINKTKQKTSQNTKYNNPKEQKYNPKQQKQVPPTVHQFERDFGLYFFLFISNLQSLVSRETTVHAVDMYGDTPRGLEGNGNTWTSRYLTLKKSPIISIVSNIAVISVHLSSVLD